MGKLVASAMGWALSAGSLLVYAPMISSIQAKKSADGMSSTTWALNLAGFAVFVAYHMRMGYALSTFADFAALTVQSAIILGLTSYYQKAVSALVAVPAIGLALALLLPKAQLKYLQGAAAAATTLALLPQIAKNFKSRSGGGWSPVSAALCTGGNAMRVFTTLQLAEGNVLLLGQFGAGFLLNALLLVQTLAWGDMASE